MCFSILEVDDWKYLVLVPSKLGQPIIEWRVTRAGSSVQSNRTDGWTKQSIYSLDSSLSIATQET